MTRTLVGSISRRKQNIIINGAFDFWQRGSSFAAVASNTYTADRFVYFKGGAMVHTISRDTDVPTFAQSGFISPYSFRLNLTTPDTAIAATDFAQFQQHIEGHNFKNIAQKPFSISFWVKAVLPGVYCVAFRNGGNNRSYVAEYTINAANTWEKKTIVVPATPSAGTWNYDTGLGLQVSWILASGTNQHTTPGIWQTGNFVATANQVNGVNTGATDFRIAQVMINEGSTVAPFQRAGFDIGNELQLCQRYYEKSYDVDTAPGTAVGNGVYAVGRAHSATAIDPATRIEFKAKKRAAPIMAYRTTAGAVGWIWGIPGGAVTTATPSDSISTSHVTTWKTALALALTTGNAYYVDGHWTADAEL